MKPFDLAHKRTDGIIELMERRLGRIYSTAAKELEEKARQYFKDFERLDAAKREALDAGKITEAEYRQWRTNKLLTGKHWENMRAAANAELLRANISAVDYINGKLPQIYALNYNHVGDAVSGAVSGYSFELVDAATVKNLASSQKTLLPYKVVNGVKLERWNTQALNSQVLQGIIQGESIPDLAKRFRNVAGMDKAASIRNARTTATSAENKGRMDAMEKAEADGIQMKKIWIATDDARTREAHAELDGIEAPVDVPFVNSIGYIMCPGDPDADPENVYNCRCTLGARVVGFRGSGKSEYRGFKYGG